MRPKETYERYAFDKDSQAYIIPVALDDYNDVFDDWDPSPFKLRDIEDEFLDFLWDSVEDIPRKYPLIFEFSIPKELKNEAKERQLISALGHQFDYMLSKNARKRRHERLEEVKYFVFAITFFLISYLYPFDSELFISRVVTEGVFIGGWVFMWEVISNIFIESRELNEEKTIVKRFKSATIRFVER